MYTCAQVHAQACIHFQCARSGQAVLQCTRSVQACAHAVHKLGTGLGTCVHFQAVSKLGHSNFYSSARDFINIHTCSADHRDRGVYYVRTPQNRIASYAHAINSILHVIVLCRIRLYILITMLHTKRTVLLNFR